MLGKRLLLTLVLFVAVLSVTACNTFITTGSGDLITETQQIRNFDSIALSGWGEVIVTQNGNESLTIETDDNVMRHVKTEVESGTLKLGFEAGFNIISPSRLVFHVSVDDLAGLSISGSGNIESARIETGRLDVAISGSGDVQIADLTASRVEAEISGSGGIDLAGNVKVQNVSISGSGKYLAGDLCSESIRVSISGSGDATLCATETLDSNISGSGSLSYYGRPSINSFESGSGRIISLGEK